MPTIVEREIGSNKLTIETGKLAYKTLVMSVLAMGMAGIAVLATFLRGARNVGNGDLGGASSPGWRLLYHLLRALFAVTRAAPELVWALLLVFFLSPGILPGAVALAIHNYGVLGKLSSEVVEVLDPAPARALLIDRIGPSPSSEGADM